MPNIKVWLFCKYQKKEIYDEIENYMRGNKNSIYLLALGWALQCYSIQFISFIGLNTLILNISHWEVTGVLKLSYGLYINVSCKSEYLFFAGESVTF